jgi:hypothetical protein
MFQAVSDHADRGQVMYDYPTWSGLGVLDPPRAIGSIMRSDPAMMPISTLQLPTAIIAGVVPETTGVPPSTTVVTGTPGASIAPAVAQTCAVLPEYCNPILLGGAALAILLFAPGQMKLAAILPAALFFFGPCVADSGCPGSAD